MKGTVLLVDDEVNVIEALRRSFSKRLFRTLGATSAKEALELMREEHVDVVVSDEKMPEMTGSEFLAIVRRKYPATVRIILTGHASLDAAIRAINEGRIYRFLTKPCDTRELSLVIDQALQVRKLMTESRRLLGVARCQSDALRALERAHPGITAVERDARGAIVIDEEDLDMVSLTEQIHTELKRCAPS